MFSLKKISQNNNHSLSLLINYILPILLIFIGMFQTYREAFLLWYGQRDELTIPLLINAINQHGWGIIQDYQFPIDNWFFTLILPYKLIYACFGNNLTVITATGPIIFWMTAFLTGLIVNYITKNKIKALWGGGYLVHSVAHHISVLWGMVALLCYFLWIDYKSYIALLSAIILLSLATFSDPWLLPTFDLPILCASLSMIYLDKKESIKTNLKLWLSITLSITFTIFFYKSHFLGFFTLHDVNGVHYFKLRFSFLTLIHSLEVISYYFNIIPFCNLTKFPIDWATNDISKVILIFFTIIFNAFIFIISMSYIIYAIIKNIKNQNKTTNFLFLFIIFSILGIFSSLFISGKLRYFPLENFGNISIYTGSHFFINIFYAFIILVFIIPFSTLSQYLQKSLIFLGTMFIFTGIISNYKVWNLAKKHPSFQQEKETISILKKNNIHYAFGESLEIDPPCEIINFLTPHIVFHPLWILSTNTYSFNFKDMLWTSLSYYKIPPHQKWAFLLPDHRYLNCSPFPTCQGALTHIFGKPLNIQRSNKMTYLIYDSDQTDILHHLTSTPLTLKDFSRWQSYYPNDQMNLNNLITLNGWDWEDINDNHEIRSNKEWASFMVPIAKPQTHLHLRIKLKSSTPTSRNLEIFYKNNIITQWRIANESTIEEFTIPIDPHERNIEFNIHILNPDYSKKYGQMGITLSEVQVVDDD